jgi:hypothetical protein
LFLFCFLFLLARLAFRAQSESIQGVSPCSLFYRFWRRRSLAQTMANVTGYKLKPRLSAYGYLSRAAKDPFADLAPDAVKTIKSYLLPVKCGCRRTQYHFYESMERYCSPRPLMCKDMNSQELRLWAKDNNRADMLLHADCVEACEREEAERAAHRKSLKEAYGYLDKYSYLQGRVPDWLQDEINAADREINLPEDDVHHVDDYCLVVIFGWFKEAEELIKEGNEAAARALFYDDA